MTAANQLVLAATLLALALVAAVVLIALPSRRVPLARRRPGVRQTTATQRLAAAATESVGRLIGGRSGSLDRLLEDAGIALPLKDLVVIVASAAMAAFAFGLIIGRPWVGLALALACPVLARVAVAVLATRRRAAFAGQLDETLQMVAGSLRAGYSLPQALTTVAAESENPTSAELTRATNEARVGRSIIEALEDVAGRMQNQDFYWVTQAISINREVGGNLADVLDNVGHTIRQRSQMKRQVASLAADGKLSAIILMLLPFVVGGVLALVNPGYIGRLFTEPMGWGMLVFGTLLLTSGGFWLSRIIHIKF